MKDWLLTWAIGDGSATERLVLTVMAHNASDQMETSLSLGEMAERTALSKQGVVNNLQSLESGGRISKVKTGAGHAPSTYLLNIEVSIALTRAVNEVDSRCQPSVHQMSTSLTALTPTVSTSLTAPAEKRSLPLKKRSYIKGSLVTRRFEKCFEVLRIIPLYDLADSGEDKLAEWMSNNGYTETQALEAAENMKDSVSVSYAKEGRVLTYRDADGKKKGYYKTVSKPFRNWINRVRKSARKLNPAGETVANIDKYLAQAERFK